MDDSFNKKTMSYRNYVPQWKVTKPGELQFLFFEDQELRKVPKQTTIGETNKRVCNTRPETTSAAKRAKQ